jgi:hypothetical protein
MFVAQAPQPNEVTIWIAIASAIVSLISACFAGLSYVHTRTSHSRRGRTVKVSIDLVEVANSARHQLKIAVENYGEHVIHIKYWLLEFKEFTWREGFQKRRIEVDLSNPDDMDYIEGPTLPRPLEGFDTLVWTLPFLTREYPVWMRILVMTVRGQFKSRWLRVASARRPYFTILQGPDGGDHHIPADWTPRRKSRRQRREV